MALHTNRLIGGLPRGAQARLLGKCETIDLESSQSLHDPSHKYVYFPTGSVLSLWTAPSEVPAFEFSLIGSEGMLGGHIALGVRTPAASAHVQAGGSAWRMTAVQFKAQLSESAALQRSADRYLHVTMVQAVRMARCARFHTLNQRLARWLLMMRDRMAQTTVSVTQASMASILGVRRVGVTKAATELQRQGVIEYARGRLTILDGKALEAIACSCYAADLQSYAKFLS